MATVSRRWLFAIGCALLGVAFASSAPAGEIAWHTSEAEAVQQSQATGKPLLIYVQADFCGYCRQMESRTWSDDAVSQAVAAGFIPLRVDGQDQTVLARRLGVRGFPTTVVVTPEGEMLDRMEGFLGSRDMRGALESHAGAPEQADRR